MSSFPMPPYNSEVMGYSIDFHRFKNRTRTLDESETMISDAIRHAMALAAERGEPWLGEHDSVKNKKERQKRIKRLKQKGVG